MRWDHVQSIKEVLKHIALKTHLHALVVADRKRRGLEVAYLNGKDTSDRFSSSIYSSGAWINSPDQTSSSGAGSEAAATAGLVRELAGAARTARLPHAARRRVRGLELDAGHGAAFAVHRRGRRTKRHPVEPQVRP